MDRSPRDKKRAECEQFYRFRRLCSDFPDGAIECERETPDFVIYNSSQRIGVELTRIYIDDGRNHNSAQSLEATKTKITQLAERFYKKQGLPDVYVDLFFNRAVPWMRPKEETIARAVAETVRDNLPSEGESTYVKYRLGSGQPIEVDLIGIHRVHDFGRERWNWREAGQPLEDATIRIQAAIDEKNTRIETYLKACDRCWLLVIAPSWTPAGMVHPNAATLEHTYVSAFTRTYCLNDSYSSTTRLNTIPPAVKLGGFRDA